MTREELPPICPAQYENVAPNKRAGTHTCCLDFDHDGPHRCPVCRSSWEITVVDEPPVPDGPLPEMIAGELS